MERIWIDYRWTRTEVITIANQKKGELQKEPIRTSCKNKQTAWSAGTGEWQNRHWFSFWIWLVEKVTRVLWTNHSEIRENWVKKWVQGLIPIPSSPLALLSGMFLRSLTTCFKLIGGMWNTVELLMRLSTKSVSRWFCLLVSTTRIIRIKLILFTLGISLID